MSLVRAMLEREITYAQYVQLAERRSYKTSTYGVTRWNIMDLCLNCLGWVDEHIANKCLFGPTQLNAVHPAWLVNTSHESTQRYYLQWPEPEKK